MHISHKVTPFDLYMKYADVASLDEAIEQVEAAGARRRAGAGDGADRLAGSTI